MVDDTETVSGAVVSQTVELPSHTPDCYSLNCSVTAYNDLDGSLPSNISIPIPLRKFLVSGTQIPCVGKDGVWVPETSRFPLVSVVNKLSVCTQYNNI